VVALREDLGDIGRQWVRLNLERGGGLGPLLLLSLDLQQGDYVVPGAKGALPKQDLRTLEQSAFHLNVLDLDSSASATFKLIRELGSEVADPALVIEANLLRPRDPAVGTPPTLTSIVVIANEIVFAIESADALTDEREFVQLLGYGSGYPLNAFFFSGLVEEDFADRVERREAEPLAKALVATIHSIYDGEGYAVWVRRP
jgi:hypothetical protein